MDDIDKSVDKIVLSIDICSSSDIIEDLTLTGHMDAWESFLLSMRAYIIRQRIRHRYNVYKFTGDGWLLLFPMDVNGNRFFEFLTQLCLDFRRQFRERIAILLERQPDVVGITFGADSGRLTRVSFVSGGEYVGRPLNIACRLQNAIKDKDSKPEYKILLSRHLFNSFQGGVTAYEHSEVSRTLRNIRSGREYRCIKVHLPVVGR